MPEMDTNKPGTAEEYSPHLMDLASEAAFGKPEHREVGDYLNLQSLYNHFGGNPQHSNVEINGEKILPFESRVIITE